MASLPKLWVCRCAPSLPTMRPPALSRGRMKQRREELCIVGESDGGRFVRPNGKFFRFKVLLNGMILQ